MMSIRHLTGRAGADAFALCALVSLLPIAAPAPAQAALICTFTKSIDGFAETLTEIVACRWAYSHRFDPH